VNLLLLSDLFFLVGGACFLGSAWEWLSSQGAINGVAYAFRVCFFKEKRKYAEYLSSKKEKKRGKFFVKTLPFGGGCLLASALLFSFAF